jgi:hypothetical protein
MNIEDIDIERYEHNLDYFGSDKVGSLDGFELAHLIDETNEFVYVMSLRGDCLSEQGSRIYGITEAFLRSLYGEVNRREVCN